MQSSSLVLSWLFWTKEISSDSLWIYSNNQSCPLNLRSIRFHSQGVSCVLSSHIFSSRRIQSVFLGECVCVYLLSVICV